MNGLLQMVLNQIMSGQLENNPMMNMCKQMMQGKTKEQQIQTLLNAAQSRGFDINAKMFSEKDVKSLMSNNSPFGLRF